MRNALFTIIALLALIAPANAAFIIPGTHTDYSIQPGRSLTDVTMSVDLSVSNGLADVIFTNESSNGETAVFKEIDIDGYDDDTSTAILWNPVVVTQTSDVQYDVSKHPNGLPGYQSATSDAGVIEFQAKSSPVKYGIAPGESLHVQFDTSLSNGSEIQDYFDALGSGQDTAHCSIGFHAISALVVDGQSLSGAILPEPTSLALFAFGSLVALRRPKRR